MIYNSFKVILNLGIKDLSERFFEGKKEKKTRIPGTQYLINAPAIIPDALIEDEVTQKT